MTMVSDASAVGFDRGRPQPLVDPFQRAITYLRVSVTDRCDFRCVYCMSEHMTFLPKADLLTLSQEILITSTAGYQGRLSEAQVEVKKGRIVSEKPVQMKMPQGTLDANRLEVTETGAVIRFDGGVVMVLTPEAVNRGMQSQTAAQANAQ